MTDTEADLETNFTSGNKPLVSLFVSDSAVQEKAWILIIIQIVTAQRFCDYVGKHWTLQQNSLKELNAAKIWLHKAVPNLLFC